LQTLDSSAVMESTAAMIGWHARQKLTLALAIIGVALTQLGHVGPSKTNGSQAIAG
jgi:hypothetical protein